MKFVPVFGVRLRHAYYTDERCPDFAIEPAPDTRKLLRDHRCILKTGADRVQVLAAWGDQGPLIPLSANARFVFHLRLRNPDFLLFTDLSGFVDLADMPDRRVAVYTNLTGDTRLQPAPHADLPTGPHPPESGASGEVFADIAIHNNESLTPTGRHAPEFEVRFEARQARWVYYCVADGENPGHELGILDESPSPEGRLSFSVQPSAGPGEHPDPTDEVVALLAEQYPGMSRVRFVSDRPVPCRQAARKHLRLYRGGEKLPEPLPNPSFRNYVKTKVDVEGTIQRQDALFQIIKYLTHAFPTAGE